MNLIPSPSRLEQFEILSDIRALELPLAQQMCKLRDSWLSNNPNAESNRWGALYGELKAEDLFKRHFGNPNSRFTIATTPSGELAGYTRYSLPHSEGDEGELILIVVDPRHRIASKAQRTEGVSTHLMEQTLCALKVAGALSVTADICTSPVPNEASIRLHVANGFRYIGSGETIERNFPVHGVVAIEFSRYQRNLTQDATS